MDISSTFILPKSGFEFLTSLLRSVMGSLNIIDGWTVKWM